MNLLIWCAIGVLMAWLASFGGDTLSLQRLFIEALFAAGGAVLGGVLAADIEQGLSSRLNWPGLAAAALGGLLMLGLSRVRAYRHQRME